MLLETPARRSTVVEEQLYVVISRGPTPGRARPILVTEDQQLCKGFARLIAEALQPTSLTAGNDRSVPIRPSAAHRVGEEGSCA